MPTQTIETKYYHFSQNNSGGCLDHKPDKGIVHHVIIEAMNADHANQRAEEIGLYFDGCDSGTDCECCGDRWRRTDEYDANDTPMVYGEPAESYVDKWFTDKGEPSVAIHHLNKPFTLCGVTP